MLKKIIITIIILTIFFLLVFSFARLTRESNPISQNIDDINFIDNIFNFGAATKNTVNTIIDSITGENGGSLTDSENPNNNPDSNKKLIRFSNAPISGYGMYEKEIYIEVPDVNRNEIIEEDPNIVKPEAPETTFISFVKYSDKETGNIYQSVSDRPDERKYSETTIPAIYESFFAKRSILFRYLSGNTIVTFMGDLPEEILGREISGGNEIFGNFLAENIKDVSVSRDGNKIFYLSNNTRGVVGNIMDSQSNNKVSVFDSPFSEWTSMWSGENKVTLTTKPSGLVPGYAYILDTRTKNYDKLIGNINGLVTLTNESSDLVLYSDQNLDLRIFDVYQNRSKELRLKSHADKCVWSSDNIHLYCAIPKNVPSRLIYPDFWYQGEVSYDDEIFKINTETGQRTKIMNLSFEEGGVITDAINLKLDKKEENLFFMNKIDSYLWKLRLTN